MTMTMTMTLPSSPRSPPSSVVRVVACIPEDGADDNAGYNGLSEHSVHGFGIDAASTPLYRCNSNCIRRTDIHPIFGWTP